LDGNAEVAVRLPLIAGRATRAMGGFARRFATLAPEDPMPPFGAPSSRGGAVFVVTADG
jgi:hypothetical protein